MKKILLAFLVAGFTSAAFAAAPNPATATFDVKLTVLKACSVTAGTASDISLGSHESTEIDLAGNNTISVTCSKNTAYEIGLAPANNDLAGAGEMSGLTSGNNDKVGYQLRQTTGTGGAVWGDDTGNRKGGIGSGAAQPHTVYVTVPSVNVTPDNYLDTVRVSVRY